MLKICKNCEKEFTPKSNAKRAQFCSKECANLFRRTLPVQNCIVCDAEYVSKNKGSKYCSRSCYMTIGPTGRPPGETVTFICVGCGKDHTVPRSYPSAKLYCSNACAKKEQKKGWSKSGLLLDNGDVLIFRSGYELRFYAACLRFNVPVRNYDGPDIITSVGIYRPDFNIVQDGIEYVVETKGYVTSEAAIKIQEAETQIDNFMLVDKTKLLEIENSGF